MLDELRPHSLTATAAGLGLDPFEVVRLAVATNLSLADLRFDAAARESLRSFAGVETLWPAGAPGAGAGALARGALEILVSRGFIGERGTRRDNLLRGLDAAAAATLDDALDALQDDGLVRTWPDARGLLISVPHDRVVAAEAITEGRAPLPDGL
jgi:hypothetical protein